MGVALLEQQLKGKPRAPPVLYGQPRAPGEPSAQQPRAPGESSTQQRHAHYLQVSGPPRPEHTRPPPVAHIRRGQ